jgi:hypothetical protein
MAGTDFRYTDSRSNTEYVCETCKSFHLLNECRT